MLWGTIGVQLGYNSDGGETPQGFDINFSYHHIEKKSGNECDKKKRPFPARASAHAQVFGVPDKYPTGGSNHKKS